MNSLSFLIAKRLYFKQNKYYQTLSISFLSKIGISISAFALIVSFSALNGFQILLNEAILSTVPHGIIQLTDKSSFKWQDIVKKSKFFPEITYAEPYIVKNALLAKNKKVKLITIKSFNNLKFLKKKIFSQKKIVNSFKKECYSKYEIILSSYLAEYLSIKKNDSINLIILDRKKNLLNSRLQNFSFKIRDIFQSNGNLDSNIGYIPFEFFEKFTNIHKDINAIELHMSNPFQADKIIINVAKKINTPLFIYTWIDNYKYIYHDIKIIKTIVYLALLLLVIISCFSIASISLMTISKKTQEIAILRSIGANNFLIQMIFLYYGLRFIIIGSSVGLCIGIIIILNFQKIEFFLERCFQKSTLLENIHHSIFFLLKLNLWDVIIILVSIMIIGTVTNLYPAYYASKINPSKILKEY